MAKLRNAFFKLKVQCDRWSRRRRLKHTDFSIISNNCWAGTAVYQPFGLKYNTPTVGLFFMDEDYICFLERVYWYLNQSLEFISPEKSKYYDKISDNGNRKVKYPIALLGGDVEVHFLHYSNCEEARKKWERRARRLNPNKMLVKMSIRDNGYDITTMLNRFCNLPYKNKICFSPIPYPSSSIVCVPELKTLNLVGGDETEFTLKKIDVYSLLNSIN